MCGKFPKSGGTIFGVPIEGFEIYVALYILRCTYFGEITIQAFTFKTLDSG